MFSKNKKNIFIFVGLMISAVLISAAYVYRVDKWLEEKTGFELTIIENIFRKKLPVDAVEIILSKDKYKVGEEIVYGVQNKTGKELIMENECPGEPFEIYYFKDGGWKHQKGEASVVCGDDGEIVFGPYELKGSSLLPWQNLILNEPGRYKIEVKLENYGNEFDKEFEIVK